MEVLRVLDWRSHEAHIRRSCEYMRELRNLIGIEIGPSVNGTKIVKLLYKYALNPGKVVGKNGIITRFGSKNVKDKPPGLFSHILGTRLIAPQDNTWRGVRDINSPMKRF